jgi:hypothetical protein
MSGRRIRQKNTTGIFEPSYNIPEFCEAENISRSMLYEFWKKGEGPDYYQVGHQRRITHRARLQWQREREAAARKVA